MRTPLRSTPAQQIVLAFLVLFASSPTLAAADERQAERLVEKGPAAVDLGSVSLGDDLTLERLAPGVWRHVSWHEIEGFGRVPANGLLVVDGGEAALVDTAWTEEQTGRLLDWAAEELGAKATLVVPGHFHGDCTGGLAAAHARGAESWAMAATAAKVAERGAPVTHAAEEDHLSLDLGALKLEVHHLGAGHTPDNSVVWIPSRRVLFGGCLVRSAAAKDLGNTADADLEAWPSTIEAVVARFPEVKVVVPGHGSPGGRELLDNTLALTRAAGAGGRPTRGMGPN